MELNDQIELVREYLEDAAEFIDEYEARLLELERMAGAQPEPSMLTEILGLLHTFKGNSGMMGFASLQKYAHKLEDLFKALLSGELVLNELLVEFLMQTASVIRQAVAEIAPDNPEDPHLKDEIAIIEKFIAEETEAALAAPEQTAAVKNLANNSFDKKTNVLKVDFERLDNLLNLMAELVIYRTRLGRIESQIRDAYGEKGLVLDLADAAEQIGKVTTELHEAIMKVRMLPIKQVFMRFPRAVRDLAREKGKDINLVFEGEETELDKTVIDEIGEPLMHLIRNAIDHGIESPAQRADAGKPGQGTVFIRAFQESSHIIIQVEDDGRGIDLDRLAEQAEKTGLNPAAEISRHELMDLIFVSGISTAKEVTEVSGRGMGMDVVRKSLARINGNIEVESELNVGTRFTIKLPLTLAIISALMVEVSDEPYAIPLASVVESLRVRREDIHVVNSREVINVRDHVLPLARLSNLFGRGSNRDSKTAYMVIVQSSMGQMGLIVDSLLGRQEIVIKALDDYIGGSRGIAGATILGDGRVVLILDVLELMEEFRHQPGHVELMEAANA